MSSEVETGNLYLLAFDHRGTLQRDMFHIDGAPTPPEESRIRDAKRVIFDGFLLAASTAGTDSGLAILVDEQFGEEIAVEASKRALPFAIAVERSGGAELQYEYGTDFGHHIDRFQPDFVKALVRYNPEASSSVNRRQAALLGDLAVFLHDRPSSLLVELLVPPTPQQLAVAEGDLKRYERDMRPRLMQSAILELLEAGVEPDFWKVEGLDQVDDCRQIVEAVRTAEHPAGGVIILGRGADRPTVEHWLSTAAAVEGYRGFAIGRTIWWDTLSALLDQKIERETAVDRIATEYLRMIDVFRESAHYPTTTVARREEESL